MRYYNEDIDELFNTHYRKIFDNKVEINYFDDKKNFKIGKHKIIILKGVKKDTPLILTELYITNKSDIENIYLIGESYKYYKSDYIVYYSKFMNWVTILETNLLQEAMEQLIGEFNVRQFGEEVHVNKKLLISTMEKIAAKKYKLIN